MNIVSPISHLPTQEQLKSAAVCLSLLAGKKKIHLNTQNFEQPLLNIFSEAIVKEFNPSDHSLVDRLRPIFSCSPKQILTKETYRDYPFLETVLSTQKVGAQTFKEAFFNRLFHETFETGNRPTAILWHHVHHDLLIEERDWLKFPPEIKRFYGVLPLLQDVTVRQLLPDLPSLEDNLSAAQAYRGWVVWLSHFKGVRLLQKNLYQNMRNIASDMYEKSDSSQKGKKISIFRVFNNRELRDVFWEEAMGFLSKYEALAMFEKKLPFIERQIELFKDDPELLKALIFDHLKPIAQILEDISSLSSKMEERFLKFKEKKQSSVFPNRQRKLEGGPLIVEKAHEEAINDWHIVSLNSSVVAVLSQFFCKNIHKSLNPLVAEAKEGKFFDQLEPIHRAKFAYHSLALEDLDWDEEQQDKPIVQDDVKQDEPEPLPEKWELHKLQPLPTPSSPPDFLNEQLDKDLEHMKTTGSIIPYAASIAESLDRSSRELGDHLFLMLQGLELFSEAQRRKKTECLPLIFRSILIDCHVALEQHFVHLIEVSGKTSPQIHDLAELAQISKASLTEDQKKFLRDAHLALYWARYPACSKRYFGKRENQPPLLRELLNLSEGRHSPELPSQLASLMEHTLKLIAPPKSLKEPFLAQVEKMARESSPSLNVFKPSALGRSIAQALRKPTSEEKKEAAIHLEELTYYLPWLEQAKSLRKDFPDSTFQFWHQRNELEVDKLFKHLYAADCILHHQEDPRTHKFSELFEALDEIRSLDSSTKSFLRSFNLGIASHYHTKPSPLKGYADLAKNSRLAAHHFSSSKKEKPNFGFDFDKALYLFQSQSQFTLKKFQAVA